MTKISIIVPVYNTAKYIERCLDSIIEQTVKNETEIIIINDGSTDNSDQIIKEYITEKGKKEKINYYVRENKGIAETRNFGIEKARGKYILFVDSDDYIDTRLIEKLQTYMEREVDLIKFKLQRVKQSGEVIEKVKGPVFEEVSGQEAFNKMYSEDVLLDSPCVYLIKKELFKNNKFKRTYHEDFGLIPLIILKAKTIVSTPYYLYLYVQAPDSITRNESYEKILKKMEDCFAHYDNMIKEIENLQLNPKTLENIKIYYTNAIILKLNELKKSEKNIYIKEIKKRKMYNNIKARSIKQFIKKIILKVNIKLYLKIR